jgi:LemA protein
MSNTFIIAFLAGLCVAIVILYNQLAKARIMVQEAFSGIRTFLQQRNDVIPNMVEIVKGYAGHENSTLKEVTAWRNRSVGASTPGEQQEATRGLEHALASFYSVAEQYPDLKANTNFLHLQEELSGIEEKLNNSRRYYNGTVRSYNQKLAVFPSNLVASVFSFRPERFFEEEAGAAARPKTDFKK